MSPGVQSIAALAVVAITAIWLVLRAIAKRRNPGCGHDCGAVSPEVKKLQARLRRERSGKIRP